MVHRLVCLHKVFVITALCKSIVIIIISSYSTVFTLHVVLRIESNFYGAWCSGRAKNNSNLTALGYFISSIYCFWSFEKVFFHISFLYICLILLLVIAFSVSIIRRQWGGHFYPKHNHFVIVLKVRFIYNRSVSSSAFPPFNWQSIHYLRFVRIIRA